MDEEEDEYDETEAESLETIAEQGESQCTPITERSYHFSNSTHLSAFHVPDGPEHPSPATTIGRAKSVLEAVSSQFPPSTVKEPRTKAFWIRRLAMLEDSGEQFAFMMAGKAKIRYKSRTAKKSTAAQPIATSTPLGSIQHEGGGSVHMPHTPVNTPGAVSVDMEDSNYFNYFVSPPLDDHVSGETYGSTQELSSSTSQHLPGSSSEANRRPEGSSGGSTPHAQAIAILLACATNSNVHILKWRKLGPSFLGRVVCKRLGTFSGRFCPSFFLAQLLVPHRQDVSASISQLFYLTIDRQCCGLRFGLPAGDNVPNSLADAPPSRLQLQHLLPHDPSTPSSTQSSAKSKRKVRAGAQTHTGAGERCDFLLWPLYTTLL